MPIRFIIFSIRISFSWFNFDHLYFCRILLIGERLDNAGMHFPFIQRINLLVITRQGYFVRPHGEKLLME